MNKRFFAVVVILAVVCLAASASFAEERESALTKFKNFWRGLFNYSADTTDRSVDVVTETGKKGVGVVTNEVRRVGEVTSGDVKKAKDIVVQPLTETGKTVKSTIEGTVKIPAPAKK